MTSTRWDVAVHRALIRCYEGGWHRRPVFRYWGELEASQWWTAERLADLQLSRLRALLLHAATTSPWYRDTWRVGGLDPRNIHSLADFARWPIVDRETIRAHRTSMRSTAPGLRLIHKATGGSSGVPLQFDLDADSNERRMAAWHRGYQWAGAGPGTRQWYLWGVAPGANDSWKHRKGRLYDRLYRRTTMSCFDLAEGTTDRFLASLNRTRPDAIVAYTGAIYTLARLLDERGLRPFAPRSIVVGAEQLHEFQRELIERVFQAPVFETYGSREFMLMGAECAEHAGLHLTQENLLIEVVDEDGHPLPAGEEGNIVVTDLTNFGLPFIRYANGDRGIAASGACACGRHLPRLERVTGRRLDVLRTPDGHRLPGEIFPHLLKELPSVRRFQVIQERPDAITIRLVAPSWSEADAVWLRGEIGRVAGDRMQVELELTDDIPLTGAGKLQVVVNRLAREGRGEAQS